MSERCRLLAFVPALLCGGIAALSAAAAGAAQWLHGHGIDASNCYLPLVRLHTKLSNSGAASGSFWIYARCALR